METGKHERIQQLAAQAVMISLGVRRVASVAITGSAWASGCAGVIDIARAGLDVGVGIGIVIPGSTTDSQAVGLAVGELGFAHAVQALGDAVTRVDLVVCLVVGRVGDERGGRS